MKLEWKCSICNEILYSRRDLSAHRRNLKHYIKIPNIESKCAICNLEFNSNRELEKHNSIFHKKNAAKTWICQFCNSEFIGRRALEKHKREYHKSLRNKPAMVLANRNCQYCGRESKYMSSLRCHERYCKLNPNRSEGRKPIITDDWRKQMSDIAKEGYRSGRWHGWMNCHSSKKSYPEEFFTRVIENEFLDKEFEYNYLFFQYRLDFAWVKKKRCIEIDGSQHQRCKAQIESDKRKDRKLKEEGWTVLRIPWKCLYENTKEYIDKARKFIEA